MSNILIVDDMDLNREFLAESLANDEFHFYLAESGPQALAIIDQQPIDLVLLDITMPEMSGIEVLEKIRETYSSVEMPVIMVTGSSDAESIIQAFHSDANDYITKPVNIKVAQVRIEAQLGFKRLAEQNNEFLSIASHDLKRPLALIQDIIQEIQINPPQGLTLNPDNQFFFELIDKTCIQMKRNINHYLDRQAVENDALRLNLAPSPMNLILEDLIEQYKEVAKRKKIALKLENFTEIPLIKMDSERIYQVMDNLIGNAIKFTQPEGEVNIKVEHLDNEHQIKFSVSDTGPGLTHEDQDKLFKKYAKLSAKPTGAENTTGLGLYICKEIINKHGHNIYATNNADMTSNAKGATFSFTLDTAP